MLKQLGKLLSMAGAFVFSMSWTSSTEVGFAKSGNMTTVISVEEQAMVENSFDQSGFVWQEDRTGFFFQKLHLSQPTANVPHVIENGDVHTIISVKEQQMIEHSSLTGGFVPQANGDGFFFIKDKR